MQIDLSNKKLVKDNITLSGLTQPDDLAPMEAFLASELANHATGDTFAVNVSRYAH